MQNAFFFVLALLMIPLELQAAAEVRTISVRGEGEARVAPDKAMVQLLVQTKAKDAKSAQAKNAKEMARVQKSLREEFKIDEKDIQTSGFSVNPEYRYEQNGKQTFLGYQVNHSLSLTVRKLENLGGLLDSLVGKGTEDVSVQLQNVSYDTSQRQQVELRALEGAMKNARDRASALAGFAQQKLKGVLRISDSSLQYSPPPFARAAMKTMALGAEAADTGGTQVSAGEIVVNSNVAVDYEMN